MALVIKAKGPGRGETTDVLVGWKDYARLRRYKWRITRRGYAGRRTSVRVPGRKTPKPLWVMMSRDICGLPKRGNSPLVPHHKNDNKLDNRRGNLVIITQHENVVRALARDERAPMPEAPSQAERIEVVHGLVRKLQDRRGGPGYAREDEVLQLAFANHGIVAEDARWCLGELQRSNRTYWKGGKGTYACLSWG